MSKRCSSVDVLPFTLFCVTDGSKRSAQSLLLLLAGELLVFVKREDRQDEARQGQNAEKLHFEKMLSLESKHWKKALLRKGIDSLFE